MATRVAWVGRLAVVLAAATAGLVLWAHEVPPDNPPDGIAAEDTEDAPLPVPPVPPRIAEGDRYEQCLALLPTDPTGAQFLAQSWATAGGGDEAEHCLAQARVALGDAAEGAAMLEGVADRFTAGGAAQAAVYDQATEAWLMAGEPARAFATSSRAVALAPDTPDLRVDRAMAAEALDRWQDAAEDLTQALDGDPRRPDALVLRASAWRHLGQLQEAEKDIDAALALDPEDSEALLERGILRQHRNDAEGARADWERVIALAPDSPAADLAQQNLALLEAGPERK
jgi:tetratricopeptide (TPR) repeat protein